MMPYSSDHIPGSMCFDLHISSHFHLFFFVQRRSLELFLISRNWDKRLHKIFVNRRLVLMSTGEPIGQVSVAGTIVKVEVTRHGAFSTCFYEFLFLFCLSLSFLFAIFSSAEKNYCSKGTESCPTCIRQQYEKQKPHHLLKFAC